MKTKLNVITRLFLLCLCVVGSTKAAWADTVLFSTNFSTADGWTTEDIITSSTTSAARTIKGTEISFKGYKSSNLSVTAGDTSGSLTFTKSALSVSAGSVTDSNPNYYLAIPVTGVVGGTVTVTINVPSYTTIAYTYDDGNTKSVVAKATASNTSRIKFTISELENNNATIYIGANSTSTTIINSVSISTYEQSVPLRSSFYAFYKQSDSSVSYDDLISGASLDSYVSMNVTSTDNSTSNTSSLLSPHDFTGLGTGKYYRLKPGSSSVITIGGLSNVKSIRFYGNGSSAGKIKIAVTKLSGPGSTITIDDIDYVSSYRTIVEHTTGDLSEIDGYNPNAYYLFTITFTANYELWGLYIESAYSCTSVDAPTSLSCTAHTKNSLTFGWTAAANASEYTATLYSDSGCTSEVKTISNIDDNTSVKFSDLSANITYYCKVQSNGDGSTYCAEGNVTDAASGTTDSKDYTLTVLSNDNNYGTATAVAVSLDASETTEITAAAEPGYKFRSWAVSGTGASLSSTTTNPTTLTMGTANATVTATFSSLATYTITYNKGTNGSGSAIADGVKTEDADFTLSSLKYTYSGHVQTGWATTDGGDKAYDLGGTYTGNADLDLYPYWTETYTITYNANGGTGYTISTTGVGDVILNANNFKKTGYTFIGWATSSDNANAGIVAYLDRAAYTLTANVTLYAVWSETYCLITPATSGDAPTAGSTIILQNGDFGGSMKVTETGTTLAYNSRGLQSNNGGTLKLTVNMNSLIKEGSIIVLTIYCGSGYNTSARGYELKTASGTKVADFNKLFDGTGYATFQYTVMEEDGLCGTNSFILERVNENLIYLTSLNVTDCQPGGIISASGWNTYSSNKKLDLSTISGGTAYIATRISDGNDYVAVQPCTDIVNAGTGLMIKGTPDATFTINTSSSAATLSKTNLMQGLPNGGMVDAEDGNYVFGWPSSNATNYGFYYVDKGATLGIGKSYLHVDGGSSARLTIVFEEEETTGVGNLTPALSEGEGAVYDLQGRKVAQPTKGLYIVNGKKVIIK